MEEQKSSVGDRGLTPAARPGRLSLLGTSPAAAHSAAIEMKGMLAPPKVEELDETGAGLESQLAVSANAEPANMAAHVAALQTKVGRLRRELTEAHRPSEHALRSSTRPVIRD